MDDWTSALVADMAIKGGWERGRSVAMSLWSIYWENLTASQRLLCLDSFIRAICGGTEGSNRFSSPVYYPKCVFPWRLTSLIRVSYENMVVSSPLLQPGEGRRSLGVGEEEKARMKEEMG